MSGVSHPIEVQGVWKRYLLGSKHGSLRDLIVHGVRRLAGRNGHGTEETDPTEFWALRDVSFRVARGEMLGIIGSNGAGKSTVLKLLSRISRQTKGSIKMHGRVAALIEVGAGFHPDLTGRENIYLNGTIMGLSRKQIDRRFNSIVQFSELERFLDMPVKRYSSGMNVRLGFAVAAHINPDVLLIDEVLAVGDLPFQQKCYQRILELKAKGTTIIFISHNLEAVQRLCDRVVLLQQGQAQLDGPPLDVILRYRQDVLRKSFEQTKTSRAGFVIKGADLDVTAACLLNDEGRPSEAFPSGAAMRLELDYAAKRPIKNPSATVTLERLDGLICHEASTRLSGKAWDRWTGAGKISLQYEKLTLLPNTYQVVVKIYEDRTPAPMVYLRKQLYFHITSDRQQNGAILLDHTWAMGQAPQPA